VLPTGSGKTAILAAITKDAALRWGGRVLVLAHVKELLEQAVEKITAFAPEMWHRIGVYSAGLKSRDTDHPVIVAGIQSVYRRAGELDRFDLILLDEAHMLPPDGEGMYRTFLSDAKIVNPNVRLIGLTATPFRMTTGPICGSEGLLNSICYEMGVRELIVQGFLSPLVTKGPRDEIDTSGLHIRAGEFEAREVEALMDREALVESACSEIIEYTKERRSCLVFTSGISHAKHVAGTLRRMGGTVATVFGETLEKERARVIEDFRAKRVKYLVNVNVVTHGFDAPNVDCVAMLRPTMSPGLFYQAVGRGFRLAEGKRDCLVLDFGGNVLRHGPVDDIRIRDAKTRGGGDAPTKKCPECMALIATGYAVCPECGYEFPPPERQMHDAKASTAGILSGQVTVAEHPVDDISYSVHVKRNAPPDHPATMRVEYMIGFQRYVSEWICFEHTGWARHRAHEWWRRRSEAPVPETVEEAVRLAREGALAETLSVTVRSVTGEKYDRIVAYALGGKPDYREPGWEDHQEPDGEPAYAWAGDEDIPF